MNIVKFKDAVTNVCGLFVVLAGTYLTLKTANPEVANSIPVGVVNTVLMLGTLGGGVIGWLTGKNPNEPAKPAQ
jgi:hypothetical protein